MPQAVITLVGNDTFDETTKIFEQFLPLGVIVRNKRKHIDNRHDIPAATAAPKVSVGFLRILQPQAIHQLALFIPEMIKVD